MARRTDAGARLRGWVPRAARTRIIGWVLLLVLLALGVVTFVTWRLLIAATDERIDITLEAEIEEFGRILEGNVNPQSGEPFASVEDVLQTLITYNLARPNEKFLGYVDGEYRYQSRIEAPVLLSRDEAFTAGATRAAPGRSATSPSR